MPRNVRTIAIETTEAGQRRPYGNTYFGATLTFTLDGGPWVVTENQVCQVAAVALRYGAKVAASRVEMETFASPFFEHVRRVEPGKWDVVIVEPYTD